MPDTEAVARDTPATEVTEEIVCSKMDIQSIQEAVAHLPPQFRDVVTLYYVGEFDVASIAKRVGAR